MTSLRAILDKLRRGGWVTATIGDDWRAVRRLDGLSIQRRNPSGRWLEVRRWPMLDPVRDDDALLRAEAAEWSRRERQPEPG